MKRFLTMLAATLLITSVLCVSASASDFDAAAQELSAIGMFRGTGDSFELDREPTRAEAAIMLVRLYGAEEEAAEDYSAGKITHPFTDVPEFAAPHVAWLYSKGLTKGMSETTFGSQADCSAQNYATFLLRALGYTDGKDFEYADALTFAQEKGFYEPMMFAGAFLRDDLAALTYQALCADTADGESYLLARLIESGAVDKALAAPMTEKMELYRKLASSESGLSEDCMDMSFLMSMNMTVTAEGETLASSTSAVGSAQTIVDGTNVEMAYVMSMITDGIAMDMGIWMKDGWVYQYASDGAITQTIKYSAEDELAVFESLETTQMSGIDVSGLAMVKSLTYEKDGSDHIYTMVIGEGMGGMLEDIMGLVEQQSPEEAMDLQIGEITIVYVMNRRGEIKGMGMLMSYSTKMSVPDATGAMISADAAMDLQMSIAINALGEDVKVEYPDLSAFVEVSLNETVQP